MKLSSLLPALLASATSVLADWEPTNLHVISYDNSNGYITISWDNPAEWRLRYTKILYRVSYAGGFDEQQYEIGGRETQFTYGPCEASKDYVFKVEGGDSSGYSGWAEFRYTTPWRNPNPLDPPTRTIIGHRHN